MNWLILSTFFSFLSVLLFFMRRNLARLEGEVLNQRNQLQELSVLACKWASPDGSGNDGASRDLEPLLAEIELLKAQLAFGMGPNKKWRTFFYKERNELELAKKRIRRLEELSALPQEQEGRI